MDYTALQTFINTIGFPIFCVIVMFFMWNKEREAHKAEVDKMVNALNNNTVVLESLKTLLEQNNDVRN